MSTALANVHVRVPKLVPFYFFDRSDGPVNDFCLSPSRRWAIAAPLLDGRWLVLRTTYSDGCSLYIQQVYWFFRPFFCHRVRVLDVAAPYRELAKQLETSRASIFHLVLGGGQLLSAIRRGGGMYEKGGEVIPFMTILDRVHIARCIMKLDLPVKCRKRIRKCLNSMNGSAHMSEDECWQTLWHKYMPERDLPWLQGVHASVCRLILEFGGVLEHELDTNIFPRVDEDTARASVDVDLDDYFEYIPRRYTPW